MLREFFDKDFQHWVSFSCCLEFLIIYKKSVQVSFCGKVLPGGKTKNHNSPQTRSTKYSEDGSDLPFWVSSYSPQYWRLVFRIMPLKLDKITLYYILNKKIKAEWVERGYHNFIHNLFEWHFAAEMAHF